MQYCRVRIETTTRGQVYKKDFEAINVFGPLVQLFVSALVSEGAVQEGEHYRSLIHPHYDGTPDENPTIAIDREKAQQDYPAWLNLICAGSNAQPDTPLKYFTLELRFQESGIIYTHELSVLNLSYFWSNLQGALLKMNVLQNGDLYYPRLYLRDDDDANFTQEEASVITTADDEPLLVEVVEADDNGPTFPAIDRDVFEVLETEEVELISVSSPQRATSNAGQDQVQIYITQDTYAALQAIARTDVQIEQGGMLVGHIYRDQDHADRFVIVITDHIVAEGTTANLVELRYTFESWLRGSAQVKERFPGKRIVGWYHTHLIKMAVRSGDSGEVASTDLFFSQDDRFMHRQFFNDAWYVAMVLGQQGNAVFFRWFGDAISANRQFFVIPPENRAPLPTPIADTPAEDS